MYLTCSPSVWRDRSACGSSLWQRGRGGLSVQHPCQSRPGRQGTNLKIYSHIHRKIKRYNYVIFFILVFELSGAGNAAALCCLARLFHSGPSTLPGGLPCQRKEPRGRESIADGVCSWFCGHCRVPGGASGQSRSE